MNIDLELKKLKLNRDSKYGVGKKMGNQLWFHKNYILCVLSGEEYFRYKDELPFDFNYSILRWNEKEQELAFIECEDFDKSNEPIVGRVMRVKKNEDSYSLQDVKTPPSNPLIYHHKWLFVKDGYIGFNVKESKERSLVWKTRLGVNKNISSKIGRLDFWDQWLKQENLTERV